MRYDPNFRGNFYTCFFIMWDKCLRDRPVEVFFFQRGKGEGERGLIIIILRAGATEAREEKMKRGRMELGSQHSYRMKSYLFITRHI